MSNEHLPVALRFMLAARRAEMESLHHLVSTGELVTLIGQLVHDLQKERGYSNLWLGHQTQAHRRALDNFTEAAQHSETQMRRRLHGLETENGFGRVRLLTHIAHTLHLLDGLPRLRRQIRDRQISLADATSGFTRLIGGLLNIVFEAADGALDADITRALVAMFNFMQGKELTGQERATGVAGFSVGFFNAEQQAAMQRLRDDQQRCFAIFRAHARAPALALWENITGSDTATQLEKLRRVGQHTSAAETVDPTLSELWFDTCTHYINAMKEVENLLAEDILQQCLESIVRTRHELENHRALSRRLSESEHAPPLPFGVQTDTLNRTLADAGGMPLNRSILDRLHEQTQRLQQLDDELQAARAALEERNLIDQAKRKLIKEQGLNEQSAYEYLQRSAMNHRIKIAEVARNILKA